MSSKAEILSTIDNTKTYIGTKVKEFVNAVHCEERSYPPLNFKKGDVIRVRVNHNSEKTRPSVIIKVTESYVVSIPLTTCEDINVLCPHSKSRFFQQGFFCNSYVVSTIEYAKENFLGVFDNSSELNFAIKELKQFINKNI